MIRTLTRPQRSAAARRTAARDDDGVAARLPADRAAAWPSEYALESQLGVRRSRRLLSSLGSERSGKVSRRRRQRSRSGNLRLRPVPAPRTTIRTGSRAARMFGWRQASPRSTLNAVTQPFEAFCPPARGRDDVVGGNIRGRRSFLHCWSVRVTGRGVRRRVRDRRDGDERLGHLDGAATRPSTCVGCTSSCRTRRRESHALVRVASRPLPEAVTSVLARGVGVGGGRRLHVRRRTRAEAEP